jgi:hypothetical protein
MCQYARGIRPHRRRKLQFLGRVYFVLLLYYLLGSSFFINLVENGAAGLVGYFLVQTKHFFGINSKLSDGIPWGA